MRRNGDINCANSEGERLYPRLDYSKGFPDWWHLDRTDIKVPSEHTQHGKRYAAEISLAHFYELDHWKNQIGYITLFMQDYPNEKPWHYLDKLICKWRREEEKQRKKCGLPPAPVYKMCELYRGQERTQEDMEFFEEDNTLESAISKVSQLVRPSPVPIEDFGGNPDDKRFPLQLCQGNCDFTEDCALGLICHKRDANEVAPGCIGGEDDNRSSDYCVFDPFGPGYNVPTDAPTLSPTKTNSPTITPLPPKPLAYFGGTPPLTVFPLQICQGDCDVDNECAEGLICYQRGANEAVPGCIGGEDDAFMTDYCILDPLGNGYISPDTLSPTFIASSAPSIAPITTPVPTEAPTEAPTEVPTVSPVATLLPISTSVPTKALVNEPSPYPSVYPRPAGTPKEILNRGWEPNFLLGECEGDCDKSSDCLPGLICFSRETASVPVPGCSGGAEDTTLTDYCIYPPLETNNEVNVAITQVDTEFPTIAPPTRSPRERETASPERASPNFDDELVRLNPLSWSPPRAQLPLDLCQGDCDIDDDCGPGLVCFQRFTPTTPVPGCVGGDSDASLMDYCIIGKSDIPPLVLTATAIPPIVTPVPTPVPVPVIFTPVPDSQLIRRNDIPPIIDCSAYSEVNFQRFCDNDHQDWCCKDIRSNSNYCHQNYGMFGDDIDSACYHCCQEENGETYEVGPPNDAKPGLVPYTNSQCAELDNSARLCKAESCCDPEYADTQYCAEQRAKHPGDFERICWYCCHPSKEFIIDSRLLSEKSESYVDPVSKTMTKEETRIWHKNNPRSLGPNDVTFNHTSMDRELIVRKENFVEKGLKDEDAYFQELHSAYQRRELQSSVEENYEDVFWWPYEWLLKVGTEYYYRYEGSMTVPPCYTVNHWRVMKDPIRVAKHQITELERLLAWRINGRCEASTAGKPRKDNPDAVDVNRPVQELAKGHRMVFCECQDWPSKFPQEREWCDKWQQRDPEIRLFENPYNWNQVGF
eukprot:CAMPEP_0170807906 /NCGR_PEP_ID=MMETSP0733-20121128/33063_1 /TAXON_ID=186038 /ORGANISM="Fragilariopsis kerguelensis, Strain L26-C5" /LENGTH=983 /DNA_ID=CAMNT_0011163205 /DNA_START=740 /DNA_END=3691 /DNA_ORIENTATION=-